MTSDFATSYPPRPLRVTRAQGLFEPSARCVQVAHGTPTVSYLGKRPAPSDPCQECHTRRNAVLRQEFIGDTPGFARAAAFGVKHGEHVEGEPLHGPVSGMAGQHVRFKERAASSLEFAGVEEEPPRDLGSFGHGVQVVPLCDIRDGSAIKLVLRRPPDLDGGRCNGVSTV